MLHGIVQGEEFHSTPDGYTLGDKCIKPKEEFALAGFYLTPERLVEVLSSCPEGFALNYLTRTPSFLRHWRCIAGVFYIFTVE